MDGENYDSQDCPHICSRGKNLIVRISFSLKPKFGLNFSFKLSLSGDFGYKPSLRPNLVSLLFALIRF